MRVALTGAEIAERVESIGEPASTARLRNTLRVGVTPSAALICSTALHVAWCHSKPQRHLAMSSADEGRMLALLRGGELDLVIAPLPRGYNTAGLVTQVLYQITPFAYARRYHPLANAHSLAQLQTAAWAIVGPSVGGPVDVLKEALAVRRMPAARVAATCPDYASLLRLMAHTDLLGVLPHASLLVGAPKGQVVALRLREALPRYEMRLFARMPLRPRVERVVAELQREVCQVMSENA